MSFFLREAAAPVASRGRLVDWEEPDCLLCGGQNSKPLVEAPDPSAGGAGLWFAVVQCQACGLCYTSPRPSEETIGQFYPTTYSAYRKSHMRPISWWARRFGAPRDPRKEHDLFAMHGQGRLLDFGCGAGGFLAQMQRHGWHVTGLDASPDTVEHVRAKLGIDALVGSLPHEDLEPASFDVITMWHALEHVHNPSQVLREAHRLLTPGGRLIVAVPNIDSLPFRWFGPGWFALDLPRHLTHFAPWTLHLMLEKAGFRVGPIRLVRHSDWLWTGARRALQNGSRERWHRLLTVKPICRLLSVYCWLTSQSDCMIVSAEK
jgi:2-polyprenyl-3-methyl-5-hydroxy-6-metoxy-1,4-benzoquinol methylase